MTEGSASPAVSRAAAVLAVLAASPTTPMGPSELSRRTGTAKSTVINVCAALAGAGLLRRSAHGYLLGHRLAQFGASYLRSVREVEEFYEACRAELGPVPQTVQLAVLGDGLDAVFLARFDGTDPLHLGLASEIGRSVPAYSTASGKALLAALPAADLENRLASATLITLTEHTHTDATRLLAELDEVRDRGYATERGEIVPGVRCVGTSVPTPHRADGLLGVSFTYREQADAFDESAESAAVRRLAAAFGERIGAATAALPGAST